MSSSVLDTSIITREIAVRNGLRYFEVVIRNWGLENPNQDGLGPQPQGVTKIASGTEIELPRNLSLSGASIGPASTVDQVIISGDPNSFVGINGLSPQAAARATGNPQFGRGNIFTNEALCSMDHPVQQFIPGPITIRACNSHIYANDNDDPFPAGNPIFVEPNSQVLNTIAGTIMREPQLQLYLWIKEPGPAGWPTKRSPYYDELRRDGTFLIQAQGADETAGCWPISGRKRVNLECWALPRAANNTNNTLAGVRVLLHRAMGPALASASAWDQPCMMRSEQIYPRAVNLPDPLTSSVHVQERIQNAEGPNRISLLVENPMAAFMELRVGTNNALGDIYYSMRAED